MESGTGVTLLSLTGYVHEHILSYVGGSKGGVQALLNLRRTCRATKSWTDDLPASCARRVFSNAQIKIKCESNELGRFLKSLPPKGVNSLVLIESQPIGNRDELMSSEDEHEHMSSEEEHHAYIWWAMWDEFTAYWKGKLENLEFVNFLKYEHPTDRQILKFLKTPMMSFKCAAVNTFCNKDSVCHLLKQSDTLKRFETTLLKLDDVRFATAILTERRNSADFQFVLDCRLSQEREWNRELLQELFRAFTLAIINCVCTVRLNNYSSRYLIFSPQNELSNFEKRMFYRCIESIVCESRSPIRLNLQKFPNLKKLVLNHAWTSAMYANLPPGVEVLCLGSIADCPPYHFLPSGLTSLQFNHATSSVKVLLTGMAALSSACPLLRVLTVTWKCSLKSEVSTTSTVKFSSLKHLAFNGTVEAENGKCVVNRIVKGLQIHSTPLEVLGLEFETYEREPCVLFDEEIIGGFCEGILGDSLLKYEISRGMLGPEAALLNTRLREKIAKNIKRTKETVGLSDLR